MLAGANIDFETYSQAGYVFSSDKGYYAPETKSKSGLALTGAARYAEDSSTVVLSLAYQIPGGNKSLWIPEMPNPDDLLDYVRDGGIIKAWNSQFELDIWNRCCVHKYGWPVLPIRQTRDTMAKSYAMSGPGKLKDAAKVYGCELKDEAGTRLLNLFSIPQKKDPVFNNPLFHKDGQKLYDYNIQDIAAEQDVDRQLPDISEFEQDLWFVDQEINQRGVGIDVKGVSILSELVAKAFKKYTSRLIQVTQGQVKSSDQHKALKDWINSRGVPVSSVNAESIKELKELEGLPEDVKEVIDIRTILGSTSVAKLKAMSRMVCRDGRIHGMFVYCGASRTGRWAGRGPQPQNLPSASLPVDGCVDKVIPEILSRIAGQTLEQTEAEYGDPLSLVSSMLRGMLIAREGYEFICSDFSAIEGVVQAFLAGEQWRMDVFNTHGKIYEMSASKISGVPFEEFERHKQETGGHHPLRKKVGKVAELASGYQGWVGAWRNFGADAYFSTEEDLKNAILKWREESPAIVDMWHGLEKAAKCAIQDPGEAYTHTGRTGVTITYKRTGRVLRCYLPSGRTMCYWDPEVYSYITPWGKEKTGIRYWGVDPTRKNWTKLDTYGGKLFENVVQAVARDIMAYSIWNLNRHGFSVVLHVHDEIACEEAVGSKTIEGMERIMSQMPWWAKDWPIKAKGGWKGKRFRKDD